MWTSFYVYIFVLHTPGSSTKTFYMERIETEIYWGWNVQEITNSFMRMIISLVV